MAKKAAKKVVRKKRAPAHSNTKAKEAFLKNSSRASYFLDIHQNAQQGQGAPTGPYRELPRGAIVFAIGALDSYLAELSAEFLIAQLGSKSTSSDTRDVLKKIRQELPTLALELCLVEPKSTRVQKMKDVIVDHFHKNVSNHGSKAVSSIATLTGSRPPDVWSKIEAKGHANAVLELEKWTEIRHRIVHQGKAEAVRRQHARDAIAFINDVVEVVDSVAAKAMAAL